MGHKYFISTDKSLLDIDVSFLPKVNASINFLVSCFLVMGLYFIKKGNKEMHQKSMLTAFGLSSMFLISYVVYHFLSESAKVSKCSIIVRTPSSFLSLVRHKTKLFPP